MSPRESMIKQKEKSIKFTNFMRKRDSRLTMGHNLVTGTLLK